MAEALSQDRTLSRLALEVSSKVEVLGPTNCHALIACSKTKCTHRDLARHMYVSSLYRKSVLAAEGLGVQFSILSAKYGLLDPDQVVEPYDLTLKGKSTAFKAAWAARVDAQIQKTFDHGKCLIVLAGDDYYQPLLEVDGKTPNYFAPMKGLSLGNRLAFLNQCIRLKKRQRDVARAYELFARIGAHTGMYELKRLLETTLPKQGVYFFFDEGETTAFSRTIPRLVRVGTHGVSAGSTATLRNRLRTHFGTRNGFGNHRASVFRLHVGRAIIERDRLNEIFPNWGKGQSAPKEVTEQEAPLEIRVSEYIGKLRVLYIPIADAAGKGSMRATIERQFIALVTENICPVETSSPSWLGQFSDKATIRETGMWNVRDVGGNYDLRFLEFFDGLVSRSRQKDMVA